MKFSVRGDSKTLKIHSQLPFLTFQSVKTQRKLRQAVRLAEEIQSKQPESLVEDTGSLEERAAAETRRLQMARSDAGGTILAKEISAGFEILQGNTKEHERFDDVVSYHEVGNPGGVQQIDISRTIGPLKEYLTTSLDRFLGGNSGSNETNKNYNSPDILEWLEKLEDALAIYEQTQQPSSKYEALLEHYLRPEQAKGLHTSRTIDQFYYSSLSDTCRRDMDQVVRRYQARKFEESRHDNFQMGMVEQLWLWVIDDSKISTSQLKLASADSCPRNDNHLLPEELWRWYQKRSWARAARTNPNTYPRRYSTTNLIHLPPSDDHYKPLRSVR